MTTGKRLLAGFGAVIALMLLVAVLAIIRLDSLSRQFNEAATREGPELKLAHEIMAQANANAHDTFILFTSPEPGNVVRRIDNRRRQITDKLAVLETLADTPEAKALLAEVHQRRDDFVASFGMAKELLQPGHGTPTMNRMTGEMLQRIDSLSEAIDRLVAHEIEELQHMAETANREASRDRMLLGILVLLALAVSTAFVLWIVRSVVEPLGGEPEEARRIALAVAAGELEGDIRLREGDTRSVMAAMKQMQQNMRRMVAQLNENASQLGAQNARLEQRVQERTAQLEASNHELESMSFAVAHDLRQPLRAIEGFSTVLREDCEQNLDMECRGYAGHIVSGAQRMSEMIDAIMGLVRFTRSEFVRQPVDLSALAGSIADELRMLEPGRGIEVVIEHGMRVDADPALLRVILQNLIANAWKFTRNHENAVIEVGRSHEDGRRYYFVRDNGAGFNMEQADRLFTPFQRFHAREKFEGHGVGLASVRRAVRRHDGKVWARSESGKGATFFFVLEGNGEAHNGSSTHLGLEPGLNGA